MSISQNAAVSIPARSAASANPPIPENRSNDFNPSISDRRIVNFSRLAFLSDVNLYYGKQIKMKESENPPKVLKTENIAKTEAQKKAYAMLEKIVDLALKGDTECQKFILDILEEADRIERVKH